MDKVIDDHIEEIETQTSRQDDVLKQTDTMGTVKLTDGAIVYVPAPTADPRDPLNMPTWQKYVVLFILSICMPTTFTSCHTLMAHSFVSGSLLGGWFR